MLEGKPLLSGQDRERENHMMKLIADPEIRTYELTYLVPVSFTESELGTIKDRVAQLVAKHQGKVVTTQDWGKKNLAYALRYKSSAQQQAYFVHVVMEMTPDHAQAVEKEVALDPQVMRHLMLKAEQTKSEESKS